MIFHQRRITWEIPLYDALPPVATPHVPLVQQHCFPVFLFLSFSPPSPPPAPLYSDSFLLLFCFLLFFSVFSTFFSLFFSSLLHLPRFFFVLYFDCVLSASSPICHWPSYFCSFGVDLRIYIFFHQAVSTSIACCPVGAYCPYTPQLVQCASSTNVCWGARTDYWGCSGYPACGYTCGSSFIAQSGATAQNCAINNCNNGGGCTCDVCATPYIGTIQSSTGQCCDYLQNGNCVGPGNGYNVPSSPVANASTICAISGTSSGTYVAIRLLCPAGLLIHLLFCLSVLKRPQNSIYIYFFCRNLW